jgi:hypothetical protein
MPISLPANGYICETSNEGRLHSSAFKPPSTCDSLSTLVIKIIAFTDKMSCGLTGGPTSFNQGCGVGTQKLRLRLLDF